jgi:hypothetical protein
MMMMMMMMVVVVVMMMKKNKKEYNTKYSYTCLTTIHVVPKVVYGLLPMMGKAVNTISVT